MPMPSITGQPGDGHDREGDAEVAGEAERPDRRRRGPRASGSSRHRTLNSTSRITTMIATAIAAEGEHAAAQVVVDVLEQHRRAGRHRRRVREVQLRRPRAARAPTPCPRSSIDCVAGEPRDDLRVRRVEEERSGAPSGSRPGCRRAGTSPTRGCRACAASSGIAVEPLQRRRPRPSVRAVGLRASRASPWPARRAAPCRRCSLVGLPSGLDTSESENSQRSVSGRDDASTSPLRVSVSWKCVNCCAAVGGEQLVDGVARVHRDDGEHRLAAEQALVGDVVLVDLVALVEVAVLAGGELELRDAEAEDERDEQRR